MSAVTDAVVVEDWVPRYFRRALVLVFVAAFMVGMTSVGGTPTRAIAQLTVCSAGTLACMLDSRMQGKMFLRSYALALFLTLPVGIFAYLVWTRRGAALGAYLFLFVGFFAAVFVGRGVGALLWGVSSFAE